MPEVSIVIAIRTPADLSPETLASVRAQTIADLECVIVCESGTPDVPDERFRVIAAPAGTRSAVRNAGIRATTAPFIAFLEGEDAWEPGALEVLRTAILSQFDVALSFGRLAGLDGRPTPEPALDRRVSLRRLLVDNPVPTSATLVRRSSLNVLGFFNENFSLVEDYELWMRIAHAAPIRSVADVLARRVASPPPVDEELLLATLERLYLRVEKDWHVPAPLLAAARRDIHRRRARSAPTLLTALPHWWRSVKG